MARTVLQILMFGLGAAAILIGSMIFVAGPTFTAGATEALYAALAGAQAQTPPFTPTADSELRFYAPFWVVYGAILIRVARGLPSRSGWIPGLAGLFFAGGVGRLIARLTVGPPHPAFTMLMVTELALPAAMVGLWFMARREGPA